MDWTWFWGALGEVARNGGTLVVGLAGIVGTYMAGSRSMKVTAAHEALVYKRSVYADYIGAAGELVSFMAHFAATFSSLAHGRLLAEVLEGQAHEFPALPEGAHARLTRAESLVHLLAAGSPVSPAAARLQADLMSIPNWCNTEDAEPGFLTEFAKKVNDRFADVVLLMRADLEG